jgi:hypothetical protein
LSNDPSPTSADESWSVELILLGVRSTTSKAFKEEA